jgi:hypothetical protein
MKNDVCATPAGVFYARAPVFILRTAWQEPPHPARPG